MTPRRPLDETSRHFICSRFTTVPTPSYVYLLCIVLHGWHGVSAFLLASIELERGILHRYHCEFLPGFFGFGCLIFLLSVFFAFFIFCTKHIGRRARIDVPSMA